MELVSVVVWCFDVITFMCVYAGEMSLVFIHLLVMHVNDPLTFGLVCVSVYILVLFQGVVKSAVYLYLICRNGVVHKHPIY